jgi:hypothetical protein
MNKPTEKPDFSSLVESLIEKTKQGKLEWAPTANRAAFVASIAARIGFKIFTVTSTDFNDFGQPEEMETVRMQMLDERSNVLWDIYPGDVKAGMWELYSLARRIGNNVDARLADALNALGKL